MIDVTGDLFDKDEKLTSLEALIESLKEDIAGKSNFPTMILVERKDWDALQNKLYALEALVVEMRKALQLLMEVIDYHRIEGMGIMPQEQHLTLRHFPSIPTDCDCAVHRRYKIAKKILSLTPTDICSQIDQLRGSAKGFEDISIAMSVKIGKLQSQNQRLREALEMIPCQKCESGDGIDHHEGAGCFKKEALQQVEGER